MRININPDPLKDGIIHIWIAELDAWLIHQHELKGILSQEETDRLSKLKFQDKQDQFLVSRGILRLILAAYLDSKPGNILISTHDDGKPNIKDSWLQFNISHSGNYMICGVCKDNRIGVDIQESYQITGVDKIIQSYFHLDEIQYLDSQPEQDRMKHFFSIWTFKEAYLKAIGKGFRGSIKEIAIVPREKSINIMIENRLWSIHSIKLVPGYSSAVAMNGKLKQIKEYKLNPTHKSSN